MGDELRLIIERTETITRDGSSESTAVRESIRYRNWELRLFDEAGSMWELWSEGKRIAAGSYYWALSALRDVLDIGTIHYRGISDDGEGD